MGENASATEGSTSSESDATSSDTKTKSESTTTVQRTPDVPAAKGHGSETGPDALGIDRMADQQRKRRERNLGPATVRRLERQGEIDREPSEFQREAAELASRIADDRGAEVDRSAEGSGGETAPVQRSAEAASGGGSEGGASSLVQDVVSSSGTSLDPGVRGEMESKMGTNFGDVRVHTGKQAGKAAEAIDAKAFTVGNHIGFNHGEFDTSSPEGKHTIAHELAHVEQRANQTRRMAQRVQEGSGLEVSDPKDPHEQEAERVAREVMAGKSTEVSRLARSAVSPRVDRLSMPWRGDSGGGGGGGGGGDQGKVMELLDKLSNLGGSQDSGGGGGDGGGGGLSVSPDEASGEFEKKLAQDVQSLWEEVKGGSSAGGAAMEATVDMAKEAGKTGLTALLAGGAAAGGGLALGPMLAVAGGAGIIGFLTKIAAGKFGEKAKKYAEDKGILDSIPGIGGGGGGSQTGQQQPQDLN